jgi:hypothetical protein
VVGLGLGVFDLVIIDEAHKSRGGDSGLSRILDGVVLAGDAVRHLAMTATPVELDVGQWRQTLRRIGVDAAALSGPGATSSSAMRRPACGCASRRTALRRWSVSAVRRPLSRRH